MKKLAMLMVVGIIAVSACAETYELADYLPYPDFEGPIVGWGSASAFNEPDWALVDDDNDENNTNLEIMGWATDYWQPHHLYTRDIGLGTEGAQSGDIAVLLFSTTSSYLNASIICSPQIPLLTGDTWQFSVWVKGEYDQSGGWDTADLDIFIMDAVGTTYAWQNTSATEFSDSEWTKVTYSGTYTGFDMDVDEWTIFLRGTCTETTPPYTAPIFQTLVIDSIGYYNDDAPIPGDANHDGYVDIADYTLWAAGYGTGTTWEEGDFNDDGVVDIADYTLWAENYNPAPASMVTPEPATMSLLVLGGLGLLKRRKSL